MTLIRYKLLLECAPYPFEIMVVAMSLKSAIQKGKYQAARHNLKTGKLIEHEEMGIVATR